MHYLSASKLRLLVGTALLANIVSPAFAETAPGAAAAPVAADAAKAQPATADEPQSTEGPQIQDIVVTATKRETNLQSTPIAMCRACTISLTAASRRCASRPSKRASRR